MTIWERILDALTGITWPKAANVLIPEDGSDYPDEFLIYLLVSSPVEQFADDEEIMRSYRVQLSLYSRNGLTNLPDVNTPMKSAGFLPSDVRELPYNPSTRHFGLAMDFVYLDCED